jgi:hypothetical protein
MFSSEKQDSVVRASWSRRSESPGIAQGLAKEHADQITFMCGYSCNERGKMRVAGHERLARLASRAPLVGQIDTRTVDCMSRENRTKVSERTMKIQGYKNFTAGHKRLTRSDFLLVGQLVHRAEGG